MAARQAEIDRKIAEEREKSGDSADNSSERKKKDKNKKKNTAKSTDRISNLTIGEGVDFKELNAAQRQAVEKIRFVSEILDGMNFVIENIPIEMGGVNGHTKNNTVFININAGRLDSDVGDFAVSQALTHELVHKIAENAPLYYEELKNFIADNYYPGRSLDYAVSERKEQ